MNNSPLGTKHVRLCKICGWSGAGNLLIKTVFRHSLPTLIVPLSRHTAAAIQREGANHGEAN